MGNIDKKRRQMLRNKNINYSRGMFFVTMQAAFNKTIFGAIVGEKCVLNELGEAVAASLQSLGERYAGVEIDEFVVMPNHVHFIVRVGKTGTEPTPHSAAFGARCARGIRLPDLLWVAGLRPRLNPQLPWLQLACVRTL